MAKKRMLRVKVSDSEEMAPQEEDEAVRESTWKEWIRGTYSRYWYFVICIFVDVSLALELGRAVIYPWSYFLPLIIGGAMILTEWRLYLKIWGRKRKPELEEG
jgi:hypothetical protein